MLPSGVSQSLGLRLYLNPLTTNGFRVGATLWLRWYGVAGCWIGAGPVGSGADAVRESTHKGCPYERWQGMREGPEANAIHPQPLYAVRAR